MIDLVALVPRGEQPGSARDRSGLGIVLDRPHLARELGGRDHVDPGDAQEQHIGRLGQQLGQLALDRPDAGSWRAGRRRARGRTGDGATPAPRPRGRTAPRRRSSPGWADGRADRPAEPVGSGRPRRPATIAAAEPRSLATQRAAAESKTSSKHFEYPGMND